MRRLIVSIVLVLGVTLLSGCGQKGPLTLPRAQVAAPASAASAGAAPATPATAATPAAASSSH